MVSWLSNLGKSDFYIQFLPISQGYLYPIFKEGGKYIFPFGIQRENIIKLWIIVGTGPLVAHYFTKISQRISWLRLENFYGQHSYYLSDWFKAILLAIS